MTKGAHFNKRIVYNGNEWVSVQGAVLLLATCPSEIAIDFRWAGTCCFSHVLFLASTSPEESATTNAMDDQTVLRAPYAMSVRTASRK